MSIPFIRLRFFMEMEIPIYPYFLEALFRGAFGYNLKKLVCINKNEECEECFLRKSCIFAIMFYPKELDKNIKFRNIKTAPANYNFFFYRRGKNKTMIMELILFRDCFNFLNHIIYAFLKMQDRGIGKNKIKYKIINIADTYDNKIIYDAQNNSLTEPKIQKFVFPIYNDESSENKKIKIEIMSPLRISTKKEFLNEISFKDLIKSSLIRISLLNQIFGENEIEINAKEILEQAKSIATVKSELQWKNQRRFSSTQNQKISMGGITGFIEYEGIVEKFKSILEGAELFGIGKNTSFGCGRIQIVEN